MIAWYILRTDLCTQAYSLKLEPQSSRSLAPNQRDGITQIIRLQNCSRGAGATVKLRWRASLNVGGSSRELQGSIEGLGVN